MGLHNRYKCKKNFQFKKCL